MGFMKPEIIETAYYEVDTSCGTEFVEASMVGNFPTIDDFADYSEGEVFSFEKKHGFIGRLSASGYLDSTDWTAADTYDEIKTELQNLYDVPEEDF